MKYLIILNFILLACLSACQPGGEPTGQENDSDQTADLVNPPAPGFNLDGSDPKAIALADSVMEAMGGREAWDATRFLHWTFFGRRTLLWDKKEKRVRISMDGDSTIYLLNLRDKTGSVLQNGLVMDDPDSLAFYLDRAESIWINDAYWLVMPFKLKDSGVTLKYLGRDTTQTGQSAEVLQLTFEEVGKTPQNKYHVFIDPATHRITEWRYFAQASDAEPSMATPWLDYRPYGKILLSGDRGRAKLTDIAVLDEVSEIAFTELDPLDLPVSE